jgi:hypothetical protein
MQLFNLLPVGATMAAPMWSWWGQSTNSNVPAKPPATEQVDESSAVQGDCKEEVREARRDDGGEWIEDPVVRAAYLEQAKI